MAGKRRDYDYGRIAENLALLGAQVAGFAVPIKPALDLLRALRRQGLPADDKEFVERLLVQIDLWRRDHPDEVAAVGGLPSGWEDRLLDRVASEPPAGRAATAQLLATAVFDSPLMASGQARLEMVAGELAAALPELIVRAGDPHGIFAALRALFVSDLATLEAKLDHLDPEVAPAVADALVAGYLARLVDSLDRDTWSARERDDNSPPVSLSTIQQTLTLRPEASRPDQPPVSLPDLVGSCDRLVILGGPGAGKTWAARRIAIQSADQAAAHLAAGKPLQSIELPLFATCSEVLEEGESSRWDRLINATLNWADDAPGDRPALVRVLARHDKSLVVLDGLDEATGLEDRALHALLSARSSGTNRLVLTSRVGSWNTGLLHLEPGNEHHQVGDLQPFTHADTIAAVRAWLQDAPASRHRLLELLRDPDSALSRQASMPLLCAMFCLVARQDLDRDGYDHFDLSQPGRRLDLYDTVIDKLLRATWRGITPTPSDGHIDDILQDATAWLEDLAADGNIDDPAGTGLGKWPDVIQPTRRLPSGTARYVDHVAPPARRHSRGGRQGRRFVHRSLRQHLTARTLCRQPATQLAQTLVQHLWFDPDWEEVIPKVIAGHEDADELVDELVRLTDGVAPSDPTHALDNALLKVAALTHHHGDGFARRDSLIERAIHSTLERNDPGEWARHLGDTAHWPATNAARIRLLDLLASPDIGPVAAAGLAEALAALGPRDALAQRSAERVVELLASPDIDPWAAAGLAEALVALAPSCSPPLQLAERVVELLASPDIDPVAAAELARALIALRPTDAHAQRSAERVVELLASPDIDPVAAARLARALVALAPSCSRRLQLAERVVELLASPDIDPWPAAELAPALVALGPTDALVQCSAERILDLLASPDIDWVAAAGLGRALVALAPSCSPPLQLAERVVELLASPDIAPVAAGLARALVALGPTDALVQHSAKRILDLLASPDIDWVAAAELARALVALGPRDALAQRSAERVVELLAGPDIDLVAAAGLARALVAFGPTDALAQRSAERILDLLASPDVDWVAAAGLAEALVALGPRDALAQRSAERVVELLAGPDIDPWAAAGLAEALVALAPSCSPPQQLAERVVELLAGPDVDPPAAAGLARALVTLAPSCSPPQQLAERVVELLAGPDVDPPAAAGLAEALVALAPSCSPPQQLAERLLDLLASPDLCPVAAPGLAGALGTLRRSLDFESWKAAFRRVSPSRRTLAPS